MDTAQRSRIRKTFEHQLQASAQAVFPLLCPVREYEWVPGWQCTLVCSQSGVAEDHCVFTTNRQGIESTWVVSRYEPRQTSIGFSIFHAGLYVERLDIYVHALGPASCSVRWERTYTPLSNEGEKALQGVTQQFEERVGILERALQHYLTTGEKISA